MSTLKVNTINAATSGQAVAVDVQNPRSFRNLIINGSYQINQRGNQTGIGGSSVYTLDRWMHGRENGSNSTRWDISQTALAKTDLPYTAGHRNCMKLDCTTASSNSGNNDTAYITQRIEGFNCSHLDWGNSGAKTLTLSFYAKTDGSTGVMCVSAYATKSYVKEVTLSNSWQKFTVEIAGNTADEIANSNASGLQLMFVLHSGSDHEISAGSWSAGFDCATSNQVNFGSSTDNNIYITGVQLEVGDTATDFEHRSYADELARCMRYFELLTYNSTTNIYARKPLLGNGTNTALWYPDYKVVKRTEPSLITENHDSGTVEMYNYSTSGSLTLSSVNIAEGDVYSGQLIYTTTSGISAGNHVSWRWTSSETAWIGMNAEL